MPLFMKVVYNIYKIVRKYSGKIGSDRSNLLKSTSLILQKRALPLIYFSSKSDHAILLFMGSNILRINMPHYKSIGVLMHNIDHDLVPSKSEESIHEDSFDSLS